MVQLNDAVAWLKPKGLWVRGMLLWTLYKLIQATIAAAFSIIIVSQASVAGLLRMCCGEPAALLKVQAAQRGTAASTPAAAAQQDSTGTQQKAGEAGATIHLRAVAADPSTVKPMHLSVDSSKGSDCQAWQLVGPYMRAYGRHAIANSQLFNPEFIHFFVPGVGSIAYMIADIYNRVVVSAIGDPLAPESQWVYLTGLFIHEFPEAYFYHASEKYAALLHDLGYWINDVGAETTLQVQSWAYTGKTRTVRAAARAARESGVRVRELMPDELTPEMRHKLQHDVSGDWLQQKAVADRELRVFVRNVNYDNIQLRDGVRIFVAEAYDPADAPPANVDPVLQGAALNAKPPKPPRVKSASKGQISGLSRNDSAATNASMGSFSSMPSLSQQCPSATTPSSSTAAAAAADPQQQQQQDDQQAAAGSSERKQPELIGFILLDPLWEGGHEVGYVSSIVRMKRSAHQGTLKLLYEDIISKLRQEGRKELAFGFAPFFNVRDHCFKRYIHWMRWMSLYLYHCANNVYAFQNLAFSKIRYGAGVSEDGSKFRDPAVSMSHIYMANKHYAPGWNIVDLYVICMYVGFMDEVFDTWLKLTGIRNGGANLAHAEQSSA